MLTDTTVAKFGLLQRIVSTEEFMLGFSERGTGFDEIDGLHGLSKWLEVAYRLFMNSQRHVCICEQQMPDLPSTCHPSRSLDLDPSP